MRLVSSTGVIDIPYESTVLRVGPDNRVWAMNQGKEFVMTEVLTQDDCRSELYQARTAYAERKPYYKFGRSF